MKERMGAKRSGRDLRFGLGLLCALCLADGRAVFGAPPPLPSAPGSLLCSWQFDTTNWLSGRGLTPKASSGLGLVASFNSNAVRVSGSAALLRYNEVESNGVTNILCNNGTIFLWVRPQWNSANSGGSGPGAYGRILELGSYSTNAAYGWWSLYLDSGGSYLFFAGQSNGSTATYLTNIIRWTSNEWQFVALTYSPSNSALYTNGQLSASGSGITFWPGEQARTNGFTLGGDAVGSNLAQSDFEMLTTFSYPVSASYVSNFYQGVYQRFFAEGGGENSLMGGGGGPLGPESETLRLTIPVFESTNLLLTITGGVQQVWYDFFGATNIAGESITNSLWDWLGQGLTDLTYAFPNQPQPNAFYVLGTPQDLDGDGLTDAFEALTSKTLSLNSDTDGDGLADGLEWLISPAAPFSPAPVPTLGTLPLNRCPVP